MDYKDMVRNAVLNASPQSGVDYQMRWACVARILGVGSTTATQLCVKFGKDPDEELRA